MIEHPRDQIRSNRPVESGRFCRSERLVVLRLPPVVQTAEQSVAGLLMSGVLGEVVHLQWIVLKIEELDPIEVRIEDQLPAVGADHALEIAEVAIDFLVDLILLP